MQYFFYLVGFVTFLLAFGCAILGDNVPAGIGFFVSSLALLIGVVWESTER